jgi:hypothetical protein
LIVDIDGHWRRVVAEAQRGQRAVAHAEDGERLDRDGAGAGLLQARHEQLVVRRDQRGLEFRGRCVGVADGDRQLVQLEDALKRRLEAATRTGRPQPAQRHVNRGRVGIVRLDDERAAEDLNGIGREADGHRR